MQRRWVSFLLVCTAAYILYFSFLIQRHREYEQAKKAYEQQQQALTPPAKGGDGTPTTGTLASLRSDRPTTTTAAAVAGDAAAAPASAGATPAQPAADNTPTMAAVLASRELQTVIETDLVEVRFSNVGARVIGWKLKPARFVINKPEEGQTFHSESLELVPVVGRIEEKEWPFDLVGRNVEGFNSALFTAEVTDIEGGGKRVRFVSERDRQGLRAIKEFDFRNGSYAVEHRISFEAGDATVRLGTDGAGVGTGWAGGFGLPVASDRVHGYVQAIVALGESLRAKSLRMGADPAEWTNNIGWAGVERKYFGALIAPRPENPAERAVAVVRPRNDAPEYGQRNVQPPLTVYVASAPRTLEPGQSTTFGYTLFVGPLSHQELGTVSAPLIEGSLPLTAASLHMIPLGMDWIRPVSLMLMGLLIWVYGILGSWGLALISLTVLVKSLLFPLTYWAMKNQAKTMYEQKKIRPELDAIMKKYAKDAKARNQAMIQVYRDHGVNPLGPLRGCLPMLLQFPVFIGLYVVFDQAVELRGQTFLWIDDLSQPDRLFGLGISLPLIGGFFNILPLVMAGTQYIAMRIMQMPAMDELQQQIQRQMMVLMPIMFAFILYHMPAGLMLYWCVSNCWTIGQSYLTKRITEKHELEMDRRSAALGTARMPATS